MTDNNKELEQAAPLTFSDLEVETAMCVWEWVMDSMLQGDGDCMAAWCGIVDGGMSGLRGHCRELARVIVKAEAESFRVTETPHYRSPRDWEVIPVIMQDYVDHVINNRLKNGAPAKLRELTVNAHQRDIEFGEFSPKAILGKAERLARIAHKGQFRKDGVTPYILHVKDVVKRLCRKNCDDYRMLAVGWLHDVLEDTDIGISELRDQNFPREIIDAVRDITLTSSDDYIRDYIPRVAINPLARVVKMQDILSNLSDDPSEAQITKYAQSLVMLQQI